TYKLYKDFFILQGVDLEPDMEVATSDLMLPLIENNLGIGFVPEKLALPLLREKKLVRIPFGGDIPKRSIQLVSDRGRGKSLAADTFYKYLRNEVRG
ncbi:MAG: LysR family transcriptional regulator substrate-binding protein, partial [Lachnospiraceae bacterium]|nr:LysR family transcriptional regulator substrate-binding protein [Lachnospiraceae bacterium]